MKRTLMVAVLALGSVLPVMGQEVLTEPSKVKLDVQGSSEVDRAFGAFSQRLNAQTDAWFKDGDFWLCIQVLEMLVAWYPESYELVTNLGWMYGNIENKPKELEIYQAFRKRYPTHPEAAYPEGQFYFMQRRYEEAIGILEPTLRMKPEPHANTYRVLANSYRRIGKLQDALRVYDLLIKKDPNDEAAKRNRDSVARQIRDGGTRS